jgi:hypothetical protein
MYKSSDIDPIPTELVQEGGKILAIFVRSFFISYFAS